MAQVVEWPESQMLGEYSGFLENCSLINSDKGLELYGSSAYLVNDEWYEKFKNNELEPITDEELARWEKDLQVDYCFPYDDTDDWD